MIDVDDRAPSLLHLSKSFLHNAHTITSCIKSTPVTRNDTNKENVETNESSIPMIGEIHIHKWIWVKNDRSDCGPHTACLVGSQGASVGCEAYDGRSLKGNGCGRASRMSGSVFRCRLRRSASATSPDAPRRGSSPATRRSRSVSPVRSTATDVYDGIFSCRCAEASR